MGFNSLLEYIKAYKGNGKQLDKLAGCLFGGFYCYSFHNGTVTDTNYVMSLTRILLQELIIAEKKSTDETPTGAVFAGQMSYFQVFDQSYQPTEHKPADDLMELLHLNKDRFECNLQSEDYIYLLPIFAMFKKGVNYAIEKIQHTYTGSLSILTTAVYVCVLHNLYKEGEVKINIPEFLESIRLEIITPLVNFLNQRYEPKQGDSFAENFRKQDQRKKLDVLHQTIDSELKGEESNSLIGFIVNNLKNPTLSTTTEELTGKPINQFIYGSMVGAALGLSNLPEEWLRATIKNEKELTDLFIKYLEM